MILLVSVLGMYSVGAKVVLVLPFMIPWYLRDSMYGRNSECGLMSEKEEVLMFLWFVVWFVVSSCMARERIFAASSRVIGLFGRKVPSWYPLIHLFSVANLMYSAYHWLVSTSENGVLVPI